MGKIIGLFAFIVGALSCVTLKSPEPKNCYIQYTELKYLLAQEGFIEVQIQNNQMGDVLNVYVNKDQIVKYIIFKTPNSSLELDKTWELQNITCVNDDGHKFTIYRSTKTQEDLQNKVD